MNIIQRTIQYFASNDEGRKAALLNNLAASQASRAASAFDRHVQREKHGADTPLERSNYTLKETLRYEHARITFDKMREEAVRYITRDFQRVTDELHVTLQEASVAYQHSRLLGEQVIPGMGGRSQYTFDTILMHMSEETTAKSAAASKRLEAIAAKHSELIEQIDWSPVQALDALRKKMAFTPFEDRGLNRAEYDFLRWVRHEADGAGTPWSRYNAVHDRRSMQHGKYLTYKLKQLIN